MDSELWRRSTRSKLSNCQISFNSRYSSKSLPPISRPILCYDRFRQSRASPYGRGSKADALVNACLYRLTISIPSSPAPSLRWSTSVFVSEISVPAQPRKLPLSYTAGIMYGPSPSTFPPRCISMGYLGSSQRSSRTSRSIAGFSKRRRSVMICRTQTYFLCSMIYRISGSTGKISGTRANQSMFLSATQERQFRAS